MKIRQGFVSNSSSSSFIVVGIQLEDDEKVYETVFNNLFNHKDKELRDEIIKDCKDWKDCCHEAMWRMEEGEITGLDLQEGDRERCLVIGKVIANDIECNSGDSVDLVPIIQNVTKQLQILLPDYDGGIKLIYGNEST